MNCESCRAAWIAHITACQIIDDAYCNALHDLDYNYEARKPLDDDYYAKIDIIEDAYNAERKAIDDTYDTVLNNHPNHLGHPMTCETCQSAWEDYDKGYEALDNLRNRSHPTKDAEFLSRLDQAYKTVRDTYLAILNNHPNH